MNTTEKRKATQIRFEGPDADVDRVSGDEIPQWYVYAADADSDFGRGATGQAIRELKPVWVQDYLNAPITAPWHECAKRAGWRASASLPLTCNDVAIGAFMLMAGEVGAFDEAIRSLLITGWDPEALALGFGCAIAIAIVGLTAASFALRSRMERT